MYDFSCLGHILRFICYLNKGGEIMKELPIATSPIQGYLHHAYVLSIGANHSNFFPWFYSNYIQLRHYRNITENMHLDYLNFYNYDFVVDFFPWLNVEKISKNIVLKGFSSVIDYLRECVDMNYYIYIYLDKFYISNRNEYQNYHFIHDHFIYGYDDTGFYSMGFDNKGLYGSNKIFFSDAEEAFIRAESKFDWQNFIFMLKHNENDDYQFDLQLVIELLEDYLLSRNTSYKARMYKNPTDAAFGLEVYNYIKMYFEMLIEDKVNYDVRPLHILYEHKKCMLLRIKFLEEEGLIDSSLGLYSDYKEVENETQFLRMSLMKYRTLKNKQILYTIVEMIDNVKKKEQKVLARLLEKLKEKNNEYY